jgi:hypothetical protein
MQNHAMARSTCYQLSTTLLILLVKHVNEVHAGAAGLLVTGGLAHPRLLVG